MGTRTPVELPTSVRARLDQVTQDTAVLEYLDDEDLTFRNIAWQACIAHAVIHERVEFGPLCWLKKPACLLADLLTTLQTFR